MKLSSIDSKIDYQKALVRIEQLMVDTVPDSDETLKFRAEQPLFRS